MVEIDGKVLEYVEEALKKNPKAGVDELFEGAKGVSAAMGKLSRRQFHARYPLQVKRRMAQKSKKARGPAPKGKAPARKQRAAPPAGSPKEGIRQIFLQFATDLAAAEARKDLVKVLAGVDRYVDDVMKRLGKG